MTTNPSPGEEPRRRRSRHEPIEETHVPEGGLDGPFHTEPAPRYIVDADTVRKRDAHVARLSLLVITVSGAAVFLDEMSAATFVSLVGVTFTYFAGTRGSSR
jgi:hypothetical protein